MRKRTGFILGAALSLVLTLWRPGHASVEEAREGLVELHRFLDAAHATLRPQGPSVLSLNGATLELRVAHTAEAPKDVERRLLDGCSASSRKDSAWRPLSMTEPRGTETLVLGVCPRPLAEIFSGTEGIPVDPQGGFDLTRFGAFFGAYLKPSPEGTSLLTWAPLGPLDPMRMFPAQGDAPGADHPDVPRPPGRRLLAAALERHVLATAYESTDFSLADYRKRVEADGVRWQSPKADGGAAFLTTRQGAHLIFVAPRSSGDLSFLVRLPPAARPGR